LSSRAAELLEEASRWRLLGLLFERPGGTWWVELGALREDCREPPLLEALCAARTALEGDYLAALGPGGLVSPREAAHRPLADPGALLAELRAAYTAFHYSPRVAGEAPDHVAVETGFVGFLRLKQAYAEASGEAEAASLCNAAARRFESEHLRALAGPLLERLASGPAHLALAARALQDRVGSAPIVPETRDELAAGCPFGCGAAGVTD
jgi:hypothetical protein